MKKQTLIVASLAIASQAIAADPVKMDMEIIRNQAFARCQGKVRFKYRTTAIKQ